ncbi:hypothetical protein Tco_1570639 [Tanacetum coccineum]
MMMASKPYIKHSAHKELYDALIQSLFMDEEDMDKDAAAAMGEYALLKRKHDDQDEDPFAGSNQGKRKKRSGKDFEPSNTSSASKKTSKGDTSPKSFKTGKSASAEESVKEATHEATMGSTPIDFFNFAKNRLKLDKITKEDLVGLVYNLLKGTCQSSIELEYNMAECFKALTDRLDWENHEGDRCPFDLSKPLPLKDSKRKYTTSITKMKAARYELVGIEYMIPKQCSTTKVGYDKDVERGIKHWGPKHQLFHRSRLNRFLKHDVYSHLKIMSVKSVTVNKMHGYGYLEEIMVRRADRQLYKFKEGDFVNLHLNDIKDMLLLVVQHKLFHLDGEVIVDLAVALHMFTRILIIKKRVENV